MSSNVKHARFGEGKKDEKQISRHRVLTMKYGKQQMMLIRKRMGVESWIDNQLVTLYNGNENNGVELELDELLDQDTAQLRRKLAYDRLQQHFCPASMDKITIFLDELIRQLATL